MTEWVIVAAVCCGVHGELLFDRRVVTWDQAVCVAYAADRQALYALRGKTALVRCWAAVAWQG